MSAASLGVSWLSPSKAARTCARTALAIAISIGLAAAATSPTVVESVRAVAGNATSPPVTDSHGVDPGLFALGDRAVSVIVQAAAGQVDAATVAARAQGADIGAGLPLVGGFVATMPASAAVRLGADPSVRAVTINRTVHFESLSYDATTTASNFARTSGATQAWAQANYGDGVGVGVIDTGVASMNDVTGRVIYGPDLSGEGTTIDSYGHGSVMAGIIGGSGADSATNSSTGYTGVAPKSWIVAVKVAGRSGAADVSTLLQAMHWMAAYKDQFNIRVVNLSWGTASTQDPHYDPLNFAVERLWGLGIVVVVAAGNSGPNAGTILKPGDDPLVITTGSYDDKQNADPADDSLSSWTSRGPTAAGLQKPDVVAPGRTLVAMRAYGSYVEQTYPKALVGASYIKGSGSSEATAVVSGLAALIIKAHPAYTPDQVKAALTSTAVPMASIAASGQGAGRVQLGAALNATPSSASWQTATANGLGSIENSRGGAHVVTDCQEDGTLDTIQGEIDVRCDPWDGASWTGASWTGASWTGASWTGASWTGVSWTGASWTGASWTGASWTGGTWTGASWQGTTSWTGASWTGASWTGASWTGASWTGASWTGASWTGASWTGADYGDDLFLNAWWGNAPPAWLAIPGEPVDPSTRRAAR